MEHAASTLTVITDKMVGIAGILYILAMVLYTFYLIFKNKNTGLAATAAGVVGTGIHLISFFMRWVEFYGFAGGGILRAVPITNLYESLMFFALLLAVFYVVIEFKTKNKSLGAFAFAISGARVLFISAIGASSNLNPLVPALQSNWLLAHVSLSFIAYVCFAVSAIAALLYLIKVSNIRKSYYYVIWTLVLGLSSATIIFLILTKVFGSNGFIDILYMLLMVILSTLFFIYGLSIKNLFKNIDFDLDMLERIIYKFITAGFAIFTIGGLVFGAVWAETSWGRYWSWDPKETWAFITWVIYGIYLHGRYSGRWSKEMAASIALIGFLVTIFTYLGVNLLFPGLHSYGSL